MDAFVYFRTNPTGEWTGGQVDTDNPYYYKLVAQFVDVDKRFNGRKFVAERIFYILNHDLPAGVFRAIGNASLVPIRSMSVGDLVIYSDYDVWVCGIVGWHRREDLREWARFKISAVRAADTAQKERLSKTTLIKFTLF
jgi:hypothetical protein